MGDLFFVVAKTGWALIQPATVLAILGAAGLLSLWWRPRWGQWLLGLMAAGYLAIGVFPVADLMLGALERRFPVDPPVGDVRGIVILGGGEDGGQSRRTGLPQVTAAGDRYLAALALAERHPDADVLFVGGRAKLRHDGLEAQIAKRLLTEAGLDPARLLLEDRSRNTAENAVNAVALMGGQPEGTWLLVTSAWHMPRAMGAFCAAGWRGLVPWPTDHRASRPGLGRASPYDLLYVSLALREWVGLAAYWASGRTDRLFPSTCE